MAKVVRKSSTRSKPKSGGNASAKRVKRVAARATTMPKLAAQASTSSPMGSFSSADDVMKVSTNAIQQMMKGMPSMPADMSSKMFSMMGKDGAAQIQKSAGVASRSMGEMMAMGKEHVDACVASSNVAVAATKHVGAELFNYANKSFSQNVEMSKELFGCRTLNDMFDLHSKVMKTNLDHFFSESVKMSEMLFKSATKAAEPINQTVSRSAKRISKTLSEAA